MQTQITPKAVNANTMAAESFLEALERYNGAVYAARVGNALSLVKRGREALLEGLNLVAVPIMTAQSLERAGYVPGVERGLWDQYREVFGPQAAATGLIDQFDPSAVEEKGGIQVYADFDVYQYPRPLHLKVGDTRMLVHGEHCELANHEKNFFESYKETKPTTHNANITRKLNDDELMRDAEYQVRNKPKQFFSLTPEARQDMREWYEEAPFGADYDRLDALEQEQIQHFVKAKDIRARIKTVEARLAKMRPAQQKAAWADVWELKEIARTEYEAGLICMNLHAYLQELMVERERGWFEAQISEHGGMYRDMCPEAVHHECFMTRDDTSYSERLQYQTDLHIRMAA